MTPQELAYYQQQQQEQEGGLLDFLGKAALAAGAVAGGIAGARYLRGRSPQQPQRRAPAQNYEAVRRVAATQMPENPAVTRSQTPPSPGANAERIRRMEQITREARAERMPGVIQTNLSAAVKQAGSPAAALGIIPATAAPVRPLQGNIVANLEELQATRQVPLEQDPELISLVRQQQIEDALEEQRFIDQENRRQLRSVQGVESKEKALAKNILASNRAEAQNIQQSTKDPTVFLKNTLEKTGYIPTETEAQQAVTPAVSAQSALAVDSAASQERGRVKAALQRNEDIPLGVVDDLEEYAGTNAAMREMADPTQMIGYEPHPDEAINTVARSLPDGLPADQAEGLTKTSAQTFLQRERDEIASQLGEQNLPITPSRIEQELSNRLAKSAPVYGPKYSARRQALELYAQTGDPILLNRIQRFGVAPASFETFETMPAEKRIGFENAPPFSTSYYPSEELFATVPNSNISVNLPTIGKTSLSELRKPVITEDTAQRAEEFYQTQKGQALDWLGDLRVKLEPKRNQILKERRSIVEQTANKLLPQLEEARRSGNQNLTAELEQNLNTLRTIWKNPRLGAHREEELRLLDAQIAGAQNTIAESIAGIQKKYPTTIADWSGESARIFGELNTETGELIPESIEIRGDRPSRVTTPKGGGGRNIAEFSAGERINEEIRAIQGGGRIRDYDPETGAVAQHWLDDNTQTGRKIGIYGIQPTGEKRDDPTKRPSEPQYTKQEIIEEAMRMSQADPYGDVPFAPEYTDVVESLGYQEPTAEAKRSVLMSEQARKGLIQFPKQAIGPYPSSVLAQPVRITFPQEQTLSPSSVQLALPSDVVPATPVAARVRRAPADVAAEQLESYMSKMQRGRSTPLTSAVRIQPSLF